MFLVIEKASDGTVKGQSPDGSVKVVKILYSEKRPSYVIRHPNRKVSKDTIDRIVALREEGLTCKQISWTLRLTGPQVRRYLRLRKQNGNGKETQ